MKRQVLSTLTAACMALAGTWANAESGKLSKEEIAAGWIMLFDGETTFGWDAEGAQVADGGLKIAGGKTATTHASFGDFELKLVTDTDDAACKPTLTLTDVWGKADPKLIALRPYEPGQKGPKAFHYKVENGKSQLKVEAPDGSLTEYPAEDWKGPKVSTFGFKCDDGHSFAVKHVYLRPLGGKSIFNGKDLTGWQAVPGHPCKFDVTPEGWLNAREGKGDLHSIESYDDFVLQLDIISNGKHLNSGIFYRSLPNQFWSGYESQIRNEWKGERTKPHDFGTGGIYNRQPARKVVSTDGEWFTKTLLVRGNHHAVWIDGYQVSDFFDNAKMANSARKGRKDDAGTLSIQGHDPTTNLSFRNIRIATLPR